MDAVYVLVLLDRGWRRVDLGEQSASQMMDDATNVENGDICQGIVLCLVIAGTSQLALVMQYDETTILIKILIRYYVSCPSFLFLIMFPVRTCRFLSDWLACNLRQI